MYTLVEFSALHSRSSRRTIFDSRCDSCMPLGTNWENRADGCANMRLRCIAKPAISRGKGLFCDHATNQSTTYFNSHH